MARPVLVPSMGELAQMGNSMKRIIESQMSKYKMHFELLSRLLLQNLFDNAQISAAKAYDAQFSVFHFNLDLGGHCFATNVREWCERMRRRKYPILADATEQLLVLDIDCLKDRRPGIVLQISKETKVKFRTYYYAHLKQAMVRTLKEMVATMPGKKPKIDIGNQSSTLRTEVPDSKTKYHIPRETIAIKVFQADRGEEMKDKMNMEQQSRFGEIEICMGYGWTSRHTNVVNPIRNELFQGTLFVSGFCRDGVFEQDMGRADAAPTETSGVSGKRARTDVKQEPDVPAMPAGAKVVKTEPA